MEVVTDQILGVFRVVESQVATIIDPFEEQLLTVMKGYFPTLIEKGQTFLRAVESPYTKDLPLMNPFHMGFIVMAYLSIVLIGQQFMKQLNTKFTLKTYSLTHNAILTALSGFMCIEIFNQARTGNYSLFGNDIVYPQAGGTRMAKIIAVFYLSKILEFNDTFIMILKRNFHQISFLHVYHHASIFMIWWLVTLWAPNGESYFSAMLNSFIHVIMYGYYFLSALGFKQVAFIKKYITSSQMIQFVCMMVQATYNIVDGLFLNPASSNVTETLKGKRYPFALCVLLWVYMVSMLALFGNFYRQDRKRDGLRRAQLKQAPEKKIN